MFNYKLTTDSKTKLSASCEGLGLIEAIDQANEAYAGLDQAVRNLQEVQDVMENIQMSLDHLDKFGAKAVETLNVDQSLECLLGISAKMITVDKAQEGLGEAMANAWDKFVEFIKNLWKKILGFFKSLFGISDKAEDEAKNLADDVKKGSDEQKKNLENTKVKKDDSAKQKAAAAQTPAQIIAAFKPQGESIISKKDFDVVMNDSKMLVTLSLENIVDVKTRFAQIDKVIEEVEGGNSDPSALIEDLHKDAEKKVAAINSHLQLINLVWDRKRCITTCKCKAVPNASGSTLKDLGWSSASISELPKAIGDLTSRIKAAEPNLKAQADNVNTLVSKLSSVKKTQLSADTKKFVAEWRRIISGASQNQALIMQSTAASISVATTTVTTLKRAWKKATGKNLATK